MPQNPCPNCCHDRSTLDETCANCGWHPEASRTTRDTIQAELEPASSNRAMQFNLFGLFQVITVVALWCAAGIARDNLTVGMCYAALTAAITWFVIGRWAVTLQPPTSRRVLAATTTAMIAGAFGVTVLIGEQGHLPLVCLISSVLTLIPWEAGIAAGLLGNLILIGMVYFACELVIRFWDSMNSYSFSASTNQGPLASGFTILLTLLSIPILAVVLTGGCLTLSGHGTTSKGMFHLASHCAFHVGMLIFATTVLIVLNRVCRNSSDPAPAWLKLLTLGFLHLYAVLLQVALFPFVFRFIFI